MHTIGSRIRELRKTLKLNQSEFASRIGSVQNTITGYETGRREPSNQVIALICREFNVNEDWLRTGEGEMLQPVSRDEEIAAFMGDVMRGETPDFRRRLMAVLAKLEPAEWELLEMMAKKLADECKEEDQA
jgi:transcriptional regulator with XRE-family HTH domain